MKTMNIVKIQMKNILGIESLECEPGKITEISGQNAVGKTSVLEAIKGVLGGGHDGKLLRNGTTEGEVVLIFDNGEKLTKKMTRDKSTLKFEDSEGRKLKHGASYIKEIIDPVGLNPIKILTADPKDKIKMLLDSVPMELPVEAIKFITGLDVSGDDRHPLKVIESKYKDIFEERAYLNKRITEQDTMISEMRQTIPFKPDGKDWASEVGSLRTTLEEKNKDKQSRIDDLATKYDTATCKIKEQAQKDIDKIQNDLASQLEKLRIQDKEISDRINVETSPELDELKLKIGEADQNSKNQAKIQGAEEYVEKHEKEKAVNEQGANAFSEQLKSLDALKGELLLNLPVEGLEVKDGNIYIKGVPFDTLNEAAKIRFCLMIAGLRKTKLPLVCVDGLEALDEGVFEIFKAEAEKTDMQFFVTRVSEEKDLTIN